MVCSKVIETILRWKMARKHPDALCEVCPLYDKPCAPSQNTEAKTAFVARSPGYYEALEGKPFMGPSGDVLNHLLKVNGVEREDVLLTNVVLCAPDAGKVPPEAIKACAPRLHKELSNCDLIIAGGSEAVSILIGRGSIDSYRGYRIDRGKQTYVATNNPALVLRDDQKFPNLVRDFKRAFHPITPPPEPEVEVIEDGDRAREYITNLLQSPGTIAADIESRGGLTRKATLVSIQFATESGKATVIGERGGLWRDDDFIANYLRPLLQSSIHSFVWHNGKFDTKILRYTYGIEARVDEDTMLLSYACDERNGVHGLEYLLAEEYGWPDYEPESVKKFKKSGEVENYDDLHRYAGYDVAGTYQLFGDLTLRAVADGVIDMYHNLLIPAGEVLRQLELNGMYYNTEAAADMYEYEVGPELNAIELELRTTLDKPIFNPRSPVQVSALYYDEWRIRHEMQKRPDMSRSVDDSARTEVLEGRFTFPEEDRAKFDSSFVPIAQEKRQFIAKTVKIFDRSAELQKAASTYIIGLIKVAALEPDNRVYTNLYLHNTTSGRLSSREPNLQNITRTKPGLPDIRKLFIAPPGEQLVQADYSQAELRCIAQFSGDPILSGVYRRGEDLHNLTASRFFGENFVKEERQTSKNMNFGMFYRQSAATFQEKHGIKAELAEKYIEWAHTEFPTVWEWEKEVEKEVHTSKVVSPFGRKRRFYLITRENRQACYREAINFYPQSTASDLTLVSLIELAQQVDPKLAKLCLTVHDSILALVQDHYVDEYSIMVKQVMESTPKNRLGWNLPFTVDVGSGTTWGNLS
jgi:DNA polymerase-1